MKKKIMYFTEIIVLVICTITHFRPIPLSGIADRENGIKMILSNFEIKNGEAYNESVDYTNITVEQKSKILTVLENYNYRRNLKTLFSDGSISDIGDKLLHIYVYENELYSDSVMVSSSGKMIVGDKTYTMKNAEEFIEQMVAIMEQKG